MKQMIPLNFITAFFCMVVLLSCNEKETPGANVQQDILMEHTWKLYQVRTVEYDRVTNNIVSDTMAQVEPCFQNSMFVFAADSVLKRTVICSTPAVNYEGRWYLKTDSTFSGVISVRMSYGTGVVYTNYGLPYGKMQLLSPTDFQLLSNSGGFTPGNTIAYSTYYLKAAN